MERPGGSGNDGVIACNGPQRPGKSRPIAEAMCMTATAAIPLPDTLPAPAPMECPPMRLLRMPEVERQTSVSRSQIYRLMQAGTFPRPVTLYGKAKAWPESLVQAWIAARIAASLAA